MARLRGRRWQADFRAENGERLRPTFSTQDAAEAWEAEANAAKVAGKPIPDPMTGLAPGKRPEGTLRTLGGLYDFAVRSEWSSLKSASTAIRNGLDVVQYFGRHKAVDKITSQSVAEMKIHFAENGMSSATVNRKASALSRMLHMAKDGGVIQQVPRIKWNREVQTKFRYLDETEEKVMLAFWAANGQPAMADLCILLIDTGARCFSEMLPVKWEHFGPNFQSVTFWATKTNQPRTVPLTLRCRKILAARRKNGHSGPWLGTGLTKSSMRHKWEVMRELTGLHDVTPHTLRHTCCTRLILGGADIKRVMTWMGHTAIATTMRYMQIRPTALEDVLHILEGPESGAA